MATNELEFEFNGKSITYTEYKIIVRKFIEKQVSSLEELQKLWIDDSKRRKFMDMLHEVQIDINILKESEKTEESDTFDVLANMVFETPLITRKERVERFINGKIDEISHNDEDVKNIVISILDKYEKGGIENINLRILLSDDMIQKDAYNVLKAKLGSINVAKLFKDVKNELYNT